MCNSVARFTCAQSRLFVVSPCLLFAGIHQDSQSLQNVTFSSKIDVQRIQAGHSGNRVSRRYGQADFTHKLLELVDLQIVEVWPDLDFFEFFVVEDITEFRLPRLNESASAF
jgi:hypothetical protein